MARALRSSLQKSKKSSSEPTISSSKKKGAKAIKHIKINTRKLKASVSKAKSEKTFECMVKMQQDMYT